MKRLLLLSSSKVHGSGYLDHAVPIIQDFLASVGRVLFVPYALFDWDAYAAAARPAFEAMGLEFRSMHRQEDPVRAVEEAEAVFVGGGNTFRLLTRLYELGLAEPLRRRVDAGMAYMGASAGSNLACPTLKTTNDMPIVEPPSFRALGLVPFQINPHYVDPDPVSTHQGETREQRIREFLEENDYTVIGLREGGILRIEGSRMTLTGVAGAKVFRRSKPPEEIEPDTRLDVLLATG